MLQIEWISQPVQKNRSYSLPLESPHPADQIAGPRICRNLPLTGEGKFAGKALTNGSHISTPAASWTQTPTLTKVHMPA